MRFFKSNLVEKHHGYKAESHRVTTDDGYILTIHRIVNDKIVENEEKKPAVLFLHGLGNPSDVWVLRGPKQDLGKLFPPISIQVSVLHRIQLAFRK